MSDKTEETKIEDILDVLKIVYLPNWSTHAYICKDGKIYVQLMQNRCFTKEEFMDSAEFKGLNNKFKATRIKLFDDLQKYYENMLLWRGVTVMLHGQQIDCAPVEYNDKSKNK